jgi:glutamate-1-semialdehyde 2,1-aminomutase
MATPVLAAIMPLFHYDGDQFYNADGSSDDVAARRRQSMAKLSTRWGPKGKRDRDAPSGNDEVDRVALVRQYLADTRFTKSVNTFFPFQQHLKSNLDPIFVLDHVTDHDNHVVDVDGTRLWDADCSFGVNVLGYGHYKKFLQSGLDEAKERSVCLGKLTPQVSSNAQRICTLANKEQCSFHMSGTEAIMGAVRLARFNTGRPLVCVFGGAYHGWYDGVMQLGTARPHASADLLVLRYGSEASLQLISARRHEIAAVLVNPLCAIDVNKPPPADFSLLSNVRGKQVPNVDEYGAWMRRLVETCRDAGVVSICDEVYVGFRYARVSV